MLWRKSEHSLSSHSKKIILERKILGGKLHVRKHIKQDLPPPNGHPFGTIYCLTRLCPF